MAAADLAGQFVAKDGQFLPFRRADVRGKVSRGGRSAPLRRKENQLRELGRSQPREAAAIACPTEGQAPVAIETVPSQVRDLERLAAHGLHRIAEQRLYFSDSCRHG